MIYDPGNLLPIIYGYAQPIETGDVFAVALAEDGTHLSSHISSDEGWAAADLGMNFAWRKYREKHKE